jgi:hypothetical protein
VAERETGFSSAGTKRSPDLIDQDFATSVDSARELRRATLTITVFVIFRFVIELALPALFLLGSLTGLTALTSLSMLSLLRVALAGLPTTILPLLSRLITFLSLFGLSALLALLFGIVCHELLLPNKA